MQISCSPSAQHCNLVSQTLNVLVDSRYYAYTFYLCDESLSKAALKKLITQPCRLHFRFINSSCYDVVNQRLDDVKLEVLKRIKERVKEIVYAHF